MSGYLSKRTVPVYHFRASVVMDQLAVFGATMNSAAAMRCAGKQGRKGSIS